MSGKSATRAQSALVVALGGCVGTALRSFVSSSFPTPAGSFPTATFCVNVIGALCLGFLLEYLLCTGADTGIRRRIRLCAGTGFCGGFTTYSTFILESDLLLGSGFAWVGLLYLLVSLAAGLTAVCLGFLWARRLAGRGSDGR